ncbi:UDP-N-acetylmuramoyl-tripeptide--D-alanyl-D-alanine ligase [Desulfohalobium retbaense]|uniref:UDP-N-acetylmuramoyl-tripeptide--D-alanyl-D-alanine ligase n=1 Tax=Desulfohalobium retbaense (strain ATCC 49708 / DSM 5692 / JCM 16813 / HR100) TaxID=485915 RepID=C8X0T7_DESRD|nr:UDP-N-acetylmuramoyl-tripeptide--D-alanyl-D-alanine ligase [Desulfohalobium retbaense]ACV68034.1 UDP-N-acetylmuramoylalanyl-D-glutamyl-2,6-diamin opimelate/D-alanyl-D-alanylligase [Desulfohalobium retbaense DSM 5692]
MQLTLHEIANATGAVGDFDPQTPPVCRIQTDSRAVQPGDLFVCLSGERFDGHNFVDEAASKGASAIIAQQPLFDLSAGIPVLLVQDTLHALGQLAGYWRRTFGGTVVAVTGSAGKTSTKECIAGVLGRRGQAAKSYKNWNNRLGVPLNILSFSGEEEFWVLEAGISEPGEMAALASIIAPDVAVVTNVAPVHLEGLVDVPTVVEEKLHLCDHLTHNGTLVLSVDYPELSQRAASAVCPKTYFSVQAEKAPYWCEPIQDPEVYGRFQLSCDGVRTEFDLPWAADYMAENLAAAACVGHRLGLEVEEIVAGLQTAELPEHRGQLLTLPGGIVIDDAYNANPHSMQRAIRAAARRAGERPLVLVLGEMAELGPDAEAAHTQLGRVVGAVAPTAVYYQGEHADAVDCGAREVDPDLRIQRVRSPQDLENAWGAFAKRSPLVLVKGSRSGRMEQYIQVLQKEFGA